MPNDVNETNPEKLSEEQVALFRERRRRDLAEVMKLSTQATTKLESNRKQKLPPEANGAEEERRREELRHQARQLAEEGESS